MSNINLGGRPGQANGSGDVLANLPEIWQKEILAQFEQVTIAPDLFRKQVLSHGKLANFRVMGKASGGFHVAGEDIFAAGNSYVSNIKHGTQQIHIDRPLIAAETMDLQDMAMHDIPDMIRMEATKALGSVLGQMYDKYAFQKVVMAARESAVLTGGDSGTVITNTNAKTKSPALIDAIMKAVQSLDEKFIPSEDRVILLRPEHYYLLLNDSVNNVSRFNLNRNIGANGSFSKGLVGDIAGVPVFKTMNFPNSDLSAAAVGDRNGYSADFSKTIAAVCHKDCIGQVILKDIQFESERSVRTMSINLLAYLMVGFGVLRPEASVEIKIA